MTQINRGFPWAIKSSVIARSLSVLNKSDQRKIAAVVVIQVAMALLDLLGVAVIGVLGALAVNGVQSKQPGNRVNQALEIFGIENLDFQRD
jgi:ATP-binding cassette subfamily C protein